MNNEVNRYDLTARSLHWASALVILWATVSGFIILLPDIKEVTKHQIGNFNVSLTFLFIPVFCLRVIYRLIARKPAHTGLTKTEINIATFCHNLMYVMVAIVLVSGVLMMKDDFTIFNLIQLSPLLDDPFWIDAFKALHTLSTRILALCVVLHIAALLRHEMKGRRILKRMI